VALGISRALLVVATWLRFLGWQSGRLRVAKLARRIMFVRGATAGEGSTVIGCVAPAPLEVDPRTIVYEEAATRLVAQRVGS
jgi:hypothetical protein